MVTFTIIVLVVAVFGIPIAMGYTFQIVSLPARVRNPGGDYVGPINFNGKSAFIIKVGRTVYACVKR